MKRYKIVTQDNASAIVDTRWYEEGANLSTTIRGVLCFCWGPPWSSDYELCHYLNNNQIASYNLLPQFCIGVVALLCPKCGYRRFRDQYDFICTACNHVETIRD